MTQEAINHQHFGEHLNTLLKERSFSISQLAEVTNLQTDLIVDLIAGQQILTGDIAISLADFFGVSPLDLMRIQSDYCIETQNAKGISLILAA